MWGMNIFLISETLYSKSTVDEEYLQGYMEADRGRKILLKITKLFWDTIVTFRNFGIQTV